MQTKHFQMLFKVILFLNNKNAIIKMHSEIEITFINLTKLTKLMN